MFFYITLWKLFFKEMQGLIWALHSWQTSRPLARQDSCLNKLPAVRPSTPSWLQETTLRFVRDHEQPFWIKLHKNNTGVLGLSVPQGSHNSSAIITETGRALKMMYRCMDSNVFDWNNIFRLIKGDSRGVRHPDWWRFSFDCTEITVNWGRFMEDEVLHTQERKGVRFRKTDQSHLHVTLLYFQM